MTPVPPESPDYSLLHIERISQYVSLSPASLNDPLPAICASVFSPLLLSYFPPARGIVLAYEDVQLSDKPPQKSNNTTSTSQAQHQEQGAQLLLRHIDEYTTPFLWATASLLIFRPAVHAILSGQITHQSHTHITLSHLNTFPVSITKDHFPASWTWHSETANKVHKGWDGRISDEGGWWLDGDGECVEGLLEGVRIRDFEGRMDGRGRGKGVMRIEGSLLTLEEERAVKELQRQGGKNKQKHKTNGVLRTKNRREEADGGEVAVVE
ncbi:hypothetical protein CC86DRAFT_310171 [Ophiobolus disseminans]|uniref:DNA-directed RNA polymerase subunit n=1 Tax=Ophiobolus disseminans TaxID=1469910 RepID=A0A6A7AJC7_9PLEO|nr:hypothetical protein CC86DRAFT_310171 [Ophiobolus disseminans]